MPDWELMFVLGSLSFANLYFYFFFLIEVQLL